MDYFYKKVKLIKNMTPDLYHISLMIKALILSV